jgi:hypothetical protein
MASSTSVDSKNKMLLDSCLKMKVILNQSWKQKKTIFNREEKIEMGFQKALCKVSFDNGNF